MVGSMPSRHARGGAPGDLNRPAVTAIDQQDGAVVVRLSGELDLSNAAEVGRTLDDACARDPDRLVVDLGDVTFIDSTGLGVLTAARLKLRSRNALLLLRPQLETRRALEISGLSRQMPIFDSLEQALAAPL